MMDKQLQRRNRKTGIMLALVALLFFVGIFADKLLAGL
jgi:hypothetical protein